MEEAQTISDTFTCTLPSSGAQGTNANSLGLHLNLINNFWNELQPQLSLDPPAPPEALMVLLEPFCVLAEGSAISSLVSYIHEHILRKAPREIVQLVVARVLKAAARTDIQKKNRDALYDTADALEKPASKPSSDNQKKDRNWDLTKPKKRQPRKKKPRKTEVSAESTQSEMSPLMLPKAAVSLVKGAKKIKRKKEALHEKDVEAAGDTAVTPKSLGDGTKATKRPSQGADEAAPKKKRKIKSKGTTS